MRTILNLINLNGTWDFVADLDPRYHDTPGYIRTFVSPDSNRRHWHKVTVPGVWQKYGERYDLFEGVGWFAREFDAGELAGMTLARLRFGAVNYACRVYLNGTDVGRHETGYTEFTVAVTATLKPGRNLLVVRVDNRAGSTVWPAVMGYFNYGGIHRDVSLEITAGQALDGVKLEAVPAENGWQLNVSGRVAGAPHDPSDRSDPTGHLLVRVSSGDGLSWEDTVGGDGTLSVCVPFMDTPAWSPENPFLVPIAVELLDGARRVIDRQEFAFGFRTLAMRDGRVQLNGRPITLKGVCYVYDSPVHGLVMTDEQIATDVALIKAAGCNAVRCHYPMDERFYAACDRTGILVWIEPMVYCYHPHKDQSNTLFANPHATGLACQIIREMVATARNHVSVSLYGIGNECNTEHPEAAPFFTALAKTAREEDPTRLLSYAALYGNVGPLAELVDVLGINSYFGWYGKIEGRIVPEGAAAPPHMDGREPIDLSGMRKMLDGVLKDRQNRLALLLTEFGADSIPGVHSASRDLWSEEYHADLLAQILALTRDYPQIVGTFPFCFADYRDPSKPSNSGWDELNLKGLVTYERRRKAAFAAVQRAYETAEGPVAHGPQT
ncbi:MAG: hypothetical protein A3K19_04895 [Lentisphaerae bacterium RIFOXYB12_FULL_65_16]|nr:MAG: hypothetical protein A3K18_15515 [Lentisphaerae bacterium RIFOXYA12_64_32]OGV89728.1 MAG: hypothetical protein A3K19_04895 [Lentisphaerae bacterium RIFOXYB12_FULL_65_16]